MKMNKIIFVIMIYFLLSCQQKQIIKSQESLDVKSFKNNIIIGKLHIPLGTVVTIQGKITWGEPKGYEGGKNIQIYKINSTITFICR